LGSCFDLSILCVTRGEPCVASLLVGLADATHSLGAQLVIAYDHPGATDVRMSLLNMESPDVIIPVHSAGYIESVHDEAVAATSRGYVLRIDDDESISPAMLEWLSAGAYREYKHWKFPRAHLVRGLPDSYYACGPLWTDHQTRLSTREMAGGRNSIHCGSPFGGGRLAPVVLIHHKFVVKTLKQRHEIVARYNSVQQGAGDNFRAFSIPEECISPLTIRPLSEAFDWALEDACRQ